MNWKYCGCCGIRKKQPYVKCTKPLSVFKDCGYTTTLKLMQIMFEKGLVKRDDSSKTHIYEPIVSKENTQKQLVDKMVNSLVWRIGYATGDAGVGHKSAIGRRARRTAEVA